MNWDPFIVSSLAEDVGDGDHTSLACIHENVKGNARLLVKAEGILAGVELGEKIFNFINPEISIQVLLKDGSSVKYGDIAFEVTGEELDILKAERLVLNCMQRMSGIATLTRQFVEQVEGFHAKIIDTRKTTPLFRAAEKWAVKIGGGGNHRFGLFDMILLKDNHIDYCGGIENAISRVKNYLERNRLQLPVEIEARTLNDVEIILKNGSINRIMLDNFSLGDLSKAVERIAEKYETEASGGITLQTVREIASTGVDFISIGALTHSYTSLDLSLKAF